MFSLRSWDLLTPAGHIARSSLLWSVIGVSLLLMLIWPAIGAAVCRALGAIDKGSEYGFMFGGVTVFFLLPLLCLGIELTDPLVNSIFALVWLSVLLLPLSLEYIRRKRADQAFPAMLTIFLFQSGFAFAQAAMGVFGLIGKQV